MSFAPLLHLVTPAHRRSCVLLAVVALALAPLGLSGAAPPDLSGTWVFDTARSEVGPNAPLAGGHLVITQKDLQVTIQMFGADGKPGVTLNFVTDGKPAPNTFGMPQTSSARWNGDKLVVAWNQASQTASAPPASAPAPNASASGPPRPRRAAAAFNWTWTLGADRNTLINEVELNPGPDASGEKWVFVRKGR